MSTEPQKIALIVTVTLDEGATPESLNDLAGQLRGLDPSPDQIHVAIGDAAEQILDILRPRKATHE